MPTTNPRSMSITEPVLSDLHARMGRVEVSVAQAHTESAARDTQIALMKSDISTIKEGTEKIYSGINRILWAIALGIVGAATTFVLNGGFVILHQ